MNVAIDENGNRITPLPQSRGTCQLCREPLIAKCGEIYVWHWQHQRDRDCDPWKEHETEWHRKWKNQFPSAWQEVPITDDTGEKHLADVRTVNGVVIEFQNSSISTSVIRIREDFYGNMVWVINANEFKDNFRIRSIVSSNLRSLDKRLINPRIQLEEDYDREIEVLSKEIETGNEAIKAQLETLRDNQKEFEKLTEYAQNVEATLEQIIQAWTVPTYTHDSTLRSIVGQLENPHGIIVRNIPKQRKELQEKIEGLLRIRDRINALKDIEIGGKLIKLIDFKELTQRNYSKAKLIKRESKGTLFLEVETIKNDFEFQTITHRVEKYDIAMDPSDGIRSIEEALNAATESLRLMDQYLTNVKVQLKKALMEVLEEKPKAFKKEIERKNNVVDELIIMISNKQISKEKLVGKKTDAVNRAKEKAKSEILRERSQVMKENKGLYSFEWKHERTTWRAATRCLYFDVGKEYLFERIDDGLFKKISLIDFLAKFRG